MIKRDIRREMRIKKRRIEATRRIRRGSNKNIGAVCDPVIMEYSVLREARPEIVCEITTAAAAAARTAKEKNSCFLKLTKIRLVIYNI